jgi:carbon monoxide dehydrogenase subunit G
LTPGTAGTAATAKAPGNFPCESRNMNVKIAIERSVDIGAPRARVLKMIEDLESTIRRFPKLRKLKKLADHEYLWEMSAIGSRIANIAHEVSYAARYQVDPRRGVVTFSPVRGHGNATIAGEFRLEEHGKSTQLFFRVEGELRDVPVPLLYRVVAPAFIQGKFTRLVDVFLERTAEAAMEAEAA